MPISITPPPPESATRTSTNPLITLPEGTNTALIPLPTEAIARTFQQGHDLVILLTDGHRITLADFFVLPDPALILRNPTTGDHTEILLDEKGTLIGQQPRSVSELAERFTSAELIDWQAAETTTATTPETSTATATQTTGAGTGWTTATRLGVLAGSAAVLSALTTAARGTKGERPEGAANQTETETDSSDGSESSGAGTETDTDTQRGEAGTEGDEEDSDAGMPTDQDTDTDEGTDAETSEETPDTDTDTHNPPQPVDPATHGETDGEDASTDSDDSDRPDSDSTEGSGETSTATAGTNTNTDNADQQDSDQDSTNTAPAPPVDPNAETEGDSGIDQDGGGTAPDNRGTDPDEGGDNADHEDADSMAPPPPVDQNNTAGSEQNESDGSENEPLTNGVDSIDTDGENSIAGPGPANSPGSVIINGTETEDQVLTATLNDADGLPDGVNIRYQWQRNTGADSAFENIDNATSKTYTLGDDDVGREVQVMVSYTDDGGMDESLTSAATAVVTNVNDEPTGSVAIGGTATEDETLTAETTALQDADGLPADAAGYRYQWQSNTGANGAFENIDNATGETYTLGDADVGRNIRVVVNYTDGRGTDESSTSDATTTVTNINDDPSGSVSIDGTAEEDQTLTTNTDNLDDADGLGAFSYQWQRSNGSGDFENIANATGETYTLGDDDVGRSVQVRVNYTDARGEDETVISDATAVVTNVNDAPTNAVTIDGQATEDQMLTAQTDTLADDDGLGTFSYQWQRSDGSGGFNEIQNATNQSYSLGDADVGREVRVQVNYTDARGEDETVISDATAAVGNVNDLPTGEVTIDGQATENATLTANTGTLDDADGLGALSYQWQRSNDSGDFENIENATSETYTLGDADVGREVRVVVSYTDDRGMDETLTSAATAAVGEDILNGTAGNDSDLQGGAGRQTINGLGGDDTLTGGAGDDVFRFAAGAGSDRITDFGTGDDRLLFEGGLFANLAAVQAAATESGDNLEIPLSDTETLTLVGASLNELSASTVTTLDAKGTDTSNSAPTGGVRIDGTVRQGQQLSADTTALRDADGLPDNAEGYRYQWQRSEADGTFADIENATEQTYTVAMADVGQRLQVVVRYTDNNGADETLTAATVSPAVSNANDPVIDDATNIVNGTEDDDPFLAGLAGSQRISGFGGDDTLGGRAGADILDGGDGIDTAFYLFDSTGIEINLETGTGKDGDAEGDVLIRIENIQGSNGSDRLTGNNEDNSINGFSGNDTLGGGAGDDELNGEIGDDMLNGGEGDDSLNGGIGDDVLYGQEGDDRLTGGSGNDLFRFGRFDGSDTITDFGTGDDRLEFGGGLFANLAAVRAAATQTDDGNLEITLSETETLTLEGVTLAALTADTVTTLDAEGNDTTTPPADANSASDAPAFELDDLLIDEAAITRLAVSEGMTLTPPELRAAQTASEKLALADPLEPSPALYLFDAALEGYSGL